MMNINTKKFKESIFYDSENKKMNNIFKDEDLFKALHENFDEISKVFEKYDIKKVHLFDNYSNNWESMKFTDGLHVLAFPMTNNIDYGDDDQNETYKQFLLDYGKDDIDKALPLDISTDEDFKKQSYMQYFPTRNLIIFLINPFYDSTVFGDFVDYDFEILDPKFLTEQDIWDRQLEIQWRSALIKKEKNAKNEIDELKDVIKNSEKKYFNSIIKKNELEKTIEFIQDQKNKTKDYIVTQIEKIKKIPMVKSIEVKDKIYISFGDIYLTAGVVVKKFIKDGSEQVKHEIKKVLIGNLIFAIGDGEIKVSNDKKIKNFEHPHASNGSICFGENSLKAKKYLAELDLDNLVKLLYSWAVSYSESGGPYTKLQTFYDQRKLEEEN